MEAHVIVMQPCRLACGGLWFSVRFLTNLLEGFRLMEILPITWKCASQNCQPVARASAEYLTCT